ncbi:MAG: VacB/RNase II family 3'-5' exoribonuclease [Lentisphaeria bacterium]|nr:VacB/RNase II family 3'-5' exoribonuclease [Lentisphaeria bacterium]
MKKAKKKRLRRLSGRKDQRKNTRARFEVEGILSMTASGFGFVKQDLEESGQEELAEDIFIPAHFINGAIDGDRVRVELLPPGDDPGKGPAGRVREIIERTRTEFVAEVLSGNRLRAFNNKLPEDIFIHGNRKGAKKGDWVKVRLDEQYEDEFYASVSKVIGKTGVIAADLDAVMAEFGLEEPYTEAENTAALAVEPREIRRADRRELAAVTIDPVDAKDFDDALSIMEGEDGKTVVIGVHISDVAAYIAPKTRFDRAAGKRAFTCYLPGRTLPMLPAALTAKISLQAGKDSLAHTVFLTVDKESGQILSTRREHSLIRVTDRLDYDTVQQFCDTGKVPRAWSQRLKQDIAALIGITRKMRRFRFAEENFIELPLPEIRVICEEAANRIDGLSKKISRESENLVEECMLAANSAVGNELVEKGVAGLFRIHPVPETEKIEEFSDLIQNSFGFYPGDISNRKICNEFVAGLPDDAVKPVILSLLLRAMSRAGYASKAQLHYALGKFRYSHFTSPIRRYPDLLVHQQLWNFDNHVRTRDKKTLEQWAIYCTEAEEHNDTAYYAASDRLKLRYLEQLLDAGADNMYEGVIAKVITNGLLVDIGDLGIYGFVPREQLMGDFSKSGRTLRQTRGKQTYKTGDYIYLRLARIDFVRNSAVFVPAGK